MRYYLSDIRDSELAPRVSDDVEFRPFDPLDGPVLAGRVVKGDSCELFDVFDVFDEVSGQKVFYRVSGENRTLVHVHKVRMVEANK